LRIIFFTVSSFGVFFCPPLPILPYLFFVLGRDGQEPFGGGL
jgi:hypothetical protein